ncbi:hypothetical protein D3C81_1871490 [compost metagenome]
MDIEKLHQQHLGSGAMAARDQFYAKRSALFMKLDEQLNKLAAYGSGLRNKSSIIGAKAGELLYEAVIK